KAAIRNNPYCRFWIDRKPGAESIVEYEVRFDHRAGWIGKVDPFGIMSAGRGGHPRWVVCDDILADPQKPLDAANRKY
ncbi:hypothetical protein NL349_29840, partial [Klebsiella pneumoniae]|nr:hypothetical protein [Klebsiella pneumoniae]